MKKFLLSIAAMFCFALFVLPVHVEASPNYIFLYKKSNLSETDFQSVNLSELKSIHISSSTVTNSDIKFLSQLPQIELLQFNSCDIVANDFSPLATPSTLKTIQFTNGNLTSLSTFKGTFENIERLDLRGIDFSGKTLTPLKNFTNLKSLRIGSANLKSINTLGSLTNLESLDLVSNGNIESFAPLKNLSNLKVLSLKDTNFSDMSIIKNCKSLTHLQFGQSATSWNDPLIHSGIERISNWKLLVEFPHLKNIFLTYYAYGSEDWRSNEYLQWILNNRPDITLDRFGDVSYL